MNFNHVGNYTFEDLSEDYNEYGRLYVKADGTKFPSVTTVLSRIGKDGIEKWKKRVGEEQAERIKTQAGIRGTAIHDLCERYLNNEKHVTKGHMPVNVMNFRPLQKLLDQNVNNIHCQEAPLYSDFLGVAGRVDCVAEWRGRLSIIDFKTSLKIKKVEWIKNYFMQASAYAVMFEERTGISVGQTVILITVDNEEPQVFVQKRDEYIWDFVKCRKDFRQELGY